MALSEKIEKAILSALEAMEVTSASDNMAGSVKNTLIQVNNIEINEIDSSLEEEIKRVIQSEGKEQLKSNQKIKDKSTDGEFDLQNNKTFKKVKKKITKLDSGNVKEIQNMTSKQFANVRLMSTNPFGFMIAALGKKIAKSPIAKAGPIGFIAFLALEVTRFLKNELYGAGRILDPRFREAIDKQILKWFERKEQQELKQGYKSVITTTMGGLRGNSLAGHLGGNFYYPNRVPNNFIDPREIKPQTFINQDMRAKSLRGLEANRFHGGGRFGK